MPLNISKGRLRKAFNEGRRSAAAEASSNPYDNAKLRELWEKGRAMQRAGELTTHIPAMEHGKTRAVRVQRAPQKPPGEKPMSRPPGGRRIGRGPNGHLGW